MASYTICDQETVDRLCSFPTVNYNSIRKHVRGGFLAVSQYLATRGFFWSIDQDIFVLTDDLSPEPSDDAQDEVEPIASRKPVGTNKPILITSYLLGTYICPIVFANIKAYAHHQSAEILIIPHRYANPTTLQASLREDDDAFIDPEVRPYLCWERLHIHGHDILADVRVPINNLNCLSAVKTFTQNNAILGHPSQGMQTTARIGEMANTNWATGTISKIDPADNITAKKAEFHFKFGFIILHPDGNSRAIHIAKSGQFTDLNLVVDRGEVRYQPNTSFVVWGDYHFGQHSPIASRWARELSMGLQTPEVILHDYFDAASVNPHASPYERSKLFGGCIGKEVAAAAYHLSDLAKEFSQLKLVTSNHNDMLSRYLLQSRVMDLSKEGRTVLGQWLAADFSPEQLLITKTGLSNISILGCQSGLSHGFTVGEHGHKGVNGGKTTLTGLFGIGAKLIYGHTHTPGCLGAVHNVGTLSRANMGYNEGGASSWKPSIVRVDKFGKAQHLVYFKSDWYKEKPAN